MWHRMLLAWMPLSAVAASQTNPPTQFPTAAPTRVVLSITLPTSGANDVRHDYDDVVEVTTNLVIENTDLTSLVGWFPNLVLVTGWVQITNNAALSTMTASFQKLETVSGSLEIFGNGALVELGSALPFPGGLGLVTGYVSIYNNPMLPSLGSALRGLVTITGYCSVYGNAALVTLDAAFDDLVTVTGYFSIYANPELAEVGTAFSNLVTVTGYTSLANNPSLLCALAVGSRVVTQTGTCQLTAVPTGPPTTSPASSSPSMAPLTSVPSPSVTTSLSYAPSYAPSNSPISLDEIEERIDTANETLATALDSLVAGLLAMDESALDLPETLNLGSDNIAIYFEDVQAVFLRAGPGQNIIALVRSSFTAAENLASKFTLDIALQLNTDYSCQGNSASGITLTAIHATADTERVSFPVFPAQFTGQAECLGDSPMSQCMNANTRASRGAGADKMSLPPPRAVSGTSAYVSFVVLPTQNTFISSGNNARHMTGVASKVISATVRGVTHNTVFSGGATMTFELVVDPTARIEPTTACAWWDKERQRWSNAGCKYLGRSLDGTLVECRCNHLTSFAILTDANDGDWTESNGLTETEHHSLSMFVYVCASVSIVCLMIVIAVYASVRSLRSQTKTILLNLCSIYALALALFIASALGDFEDGVCVGIGASLHFALLSTFFWMLVEGRHLMMTFVNVFEGHRSDEWRQLRIYIGVAYGVPALEVLVLACGWPTLYTRYDGFCFLSKQNGAIWAFFGPALVVISLNIYVLVMVSREVWDLAPMPGAHDSTTDAVIYKAKRAFKSSMVFGSILGVTWALGLLSLVVPSSLVYHYSFAVFNALGGVWIFGFHLLMDPEVGAAYKERTTRRRASMKVTRRRDLNGGHTRRRTLQGRDFFSWGNNKGSTSSTGGSVALESTSTPEMLRNNSVGATPSASPASVTGSLEMSSKLASTSTSTGSFASIGSKQEPLTNEAWAFNAVVLRDGSATPGAPEMLTLRRPDRDEADKYDKYDKYDKCDKYDKNNKNDENDEDRSVRRRTLWDPTDTIDGQDINRQRGDYMDAPQDPDPDVGSTELDATSVSHANPLPATAAVMARAPVDTTAASTHIGSFAPEMRRESGLGYCSRASPAYVKAPGYVKVAPAPGTALNGIAASGNPL